MITPKPNANASLSIWMPLLKTDAVSVNANESVSIDTEIVNQFLWNGWRVDVTGRSDSHEVDNPFSVLRSFTQIVPGDIFIDDVLKQVGRMQLSPNGSLHSSHKDIFFHTTSEQIVIWIGNVTTSIGFHEGCINTTGKIADALCPSLFHLLQLMMMIVHFVLYRRSIRRCVHFRT